MCLFTAFPCSETPGNRVNMCFVFVPGSGMAKRFHFICQSWEFWAKSRIFREERLNPLMISDPGSGSESGGSLPCLLHLCIRHSFIHYSATIYWASSMCQVPCQALNKCLLNKCRMVKGLQCNRLYQQWYRDVTGVGEPFENCVPVNPTHSCRSVLVNTKSLYTQCQMSVILT